MPKLINIIKRVTGKAKSNKAFFRYLNKYQYILGNVPEYYYEGNENYKDCIWQLWLQGENNAPEIVNRCLASIKKYSDKQIILLDNNNLSRYVDIPNYIKKKYENNEILAAHYSDYIRLCILSKYGGCWIDATVLLTDKIPEKIFQQQYFAFKSIAWYKEILFADSFTKKIIPKDIEKILLKLLPYKNDNVPSISNWFLYAKPNNKLINATKYFFEEYLKKERYIYNYFMFHLFTVYAVLHDLGCAQTWYDMYSISNRDVHILQSQFFESYSEKKINVIKTLSPIHKLTYKFKQVPKNSFLEYILKGDI